MPARDRYHQQLRTALEKDGWTITHDHLPMKLGKKDMYVDLGAEQLFAAEKGQSRIAVELKSFLGQSDMTELERAMGQYVICSKVMTDFDPGRELYLAVDREVYEELFEEPIGQLLLKDGLRLIVFNLNSAEILQWKPKKPSEI